MIKLNGNIPISVMEDLYSRLTDKGIEVVDFQVDIEKELILIETDVGLSLEDIKLVLSDGDTYELVKNYVSDIVSESDLDSVSSVLNNERGIVSLGAAGGIVAGGGVTSALVFSEGISNITIGPVGLVVVALLIGIYIWKSVY